MSTHFLRLDDPWFDRVRRGEKRAEIRKHDRDYQVGDGIVFVGRLSGYDGEWNSSSWYDARQLLDRSADRIKDDPDAEGRPELHAEITHVMVRTERTEAYLPEGYCLLSIEVLAVEGPTESAIRSAFQRAVEGGTQ